MNNNKVDCLLLNFWTVQNVGGILQAYALQKIIQNLGYKNKLINLIGPYAASNHKKGFCTRFAKKYMDITAEYNLLTSVNELKFLNEVSDTFIVGSDCVWHNWGHGFLYFLDFVNLNKKKIAYAPSFGNATYNECFNYKARVKYYLDTFDNISVREDSGVKILKDIFNIEATQTLDPTLIIEREYFDTLIKDIKQTDNNYILNYSIGVKNDDNYYKNIMTKISNENVYNFTQEKLSDINVEDWLVKIKNAKLLITNSYHACCFALRYNVPFWIFEPYGLDFSRFESLLGLLNLENRIIKNRPNDFDLNEPIDWDKVNAILAKGKERSLKWLKDALDAPKDLSKINPADVIIQSLQEQILDLKNERNKQKILNYNKNYRKYVKYKILKNFVFGKTRDRYKNKQKIYYEKVKSARRIKRGVAGV